MDLDLDWLVNLLMERGEIFNCYFLIIFNYFVFKIVKY